VTDALGASDFPVITIRDMVRARAILLDISASTLLFAVVGGDGLHSGAALGGELSGAVFEALPYRLRASPSSHNIPSTRSAARR